MSDYESLKSKYESAGQSQVFQFYDSLSSTEQQELLSQLSSLDVDRVNSVYQKAIQTESESKKAEESNVKSDIKPPPSSSLISTGDGNESHQKEETRLRELGLEAISKGQVGVLLMAGGQGTRLGSSDPKGCYDIGLPSKKSLFQLQAERIIKLQSLAEEKGGKSKGSVVIPWYIMTSGPTRKPTEAFFEKNSFFGLDQKNVIFFEQGTLPCLTMEGKIMLDSESRIATAPDGNGGIYTALRAPINPSTTETVISSLSSRGIQYLHAYGVDNCLVKVGDPVFIGACLSKKVQAGVKVVKKTNPNESVGVVALKDSKFNVIEYSEIPKTLSEEKDQDGDLLLRAANIANHFYTTSFLEKDVPSFESEMSFHIARKKIPTLNSKGELIKPTSPNGMKLELFIFDVFPYCKELTIHEVPREEEFSPLKNAPNTGIDDPQTSRRDLIAQQKRWLKKVGAEFGNDDDEVEVEISPLVSYSGEGLESFKGKKFEKSEIINEV